MKWFIFFVTIIVGLLLLRFWWVWDALGFTSGICCALLAMAVAFKLSATMKPGIKKALRWGVGYGTLATIVLLLVYVASVFLFVYTGGEL